MRDRVFLVTGAGSGIGRAVTGLLHDRGARLLIADVHEEGLQQALKAFGTSKERVAACVLDVRSPTAWSAAVRTALTTFGTLDGLINVAGVIRPAGVAKLVTEDIDLTIDVNVKGVLHGVAAVAPYLIERGRGCIVNVASMAAIAAVPGNSVYAASKHAVRGFSLSIAEELRGHGVRVTVVCPSLVATPMLDAALNHPEAALTFAVPRPLSVERVARTIVKLGVERGELEVVIAAPGSFQGILARLSNAFPSINALGMPFIRAWGEKNRLKLLSASSKRT